MWPSPIGKHVLLCCVTCTQSLALRPVYFFVSPRNEESFRFYATWSQAIDQTLSVPASRPSLMPSGSSTPEIFVLESLFPGIDLHALRPGHAAGMYSTISQRCSLSGSERGGFRAIIRTSCPCFVSAQIECYRCAFAREILTWRPRCVEIMDFQIGHILFTMPFLLFLVL